jgi:hypothetical protein
MARALPAVLTFVFALGCGRSGLDDELSPDGQASLPPIDAAASTDGRGVGDATADVPSFLPDAPAAGDGPGSLDALATGCSATCNGCCQGDTCIVNITPEACGSFGQACVVCPPGSICKGTCSQPVSNCGPQNCPGCCLGPNACAQGIADVACGTGGQQCVRCAPDRAEQCAENASGIGGTCNDRPCGPGTCPGGCCSNGNCVDGQSASACGANGAACQTCGPGEFCSESMCQPGTPCSPANCAGCCGGTDGNTCVAGSDDGACGLGGYVCQNCSQFGRACVNGACVVPVACSPSTCKGCCYGNICAEGDQTFLCGTGGGTCADCTAQGQQCVTGACQ